MRTSPAGTVLRGGTGYPCQRSWPTERSDEGSVSATAAMATARVGSTATAGGGEGSARSPRNAYTAAPNTAATATGVVGIAGDTSHSDWTREGPRTTAITIRTTVTASVRRPA